MDLDFRQILSQIVAFLAMLWVLKKFGWKPLLNMLDERKKTIQAEFDAIDEKKIEVKSLTEDYENKMKSIDAEARMKIQEGIQEGRKIAEEIKEETQSQAKAIISKAKDEIGREMAKAEAQLKIDLVNLSVALAEKILKEKLDLTAQEKLITDFVEKTELK